MDLIDTFNVSASGLAAQRVRLQTISSNLANSRTTRTEEGGPYQRKAPVFSAQAIDPFGSELDQALAQVGVDGIETMQSEGIRTFLPGHPDADEQGYVMMPDIDPLAEMVDMMSTVRSYEANANAIDATREMAQRALEIGR